MYRCASSQFEGESSRFHVEAQAAWRQVEGVTPHVHDDGEVHLHLEYAGVYVVDEATFPSPGILERGVRRGGRLSLHRKTAFTGPGGGERTHGRTRPRRARRT